MAPRLLIAIPTYIPVYLDAVTYRCVGACAEGSETIVVNDKLETAWGAPASVADGPW